MIFSFPDLLNPPYFMFGEKGIDFVIPQPSRQSQILPTSTSFSSKNLKIYSDSSKLQVVSPQLKFSGLLKKFNSLILTDSEKSFDVILLIKNVF